MKPRKYLTKSIFKIGLECPRKLFYLNKPDEYLNNQVEDPFLEALARGGFQVGALAQLKYPNGIEVKSKKHEEAIAETAELMKKDNVVIFEAAFVSGPLFVRADIVIKSGNFLRLIEVKSKSFDADNTNDEFLSPRDSEPGSPKIRSSWSLYLYDLAFQVYVARNNYPDLKVSASFMGLDKNSTVPEDGVHQMFFVKQDGRNKEVILTKKPDKDFKGHQILKEVDLTELMNQIIDGKEKTEFHVMGSMKDRAAKLAAIYMNNEKFPAAKVTSKDCKGCEFRGEAKGAIKSGFDECWNEHAKISDASSKQFAFDLWNFRSSHKALENQKYLLEDLDEDDLGSGTSVPRQLIQIELFKSKAKQPWLDKSALVNEMANWVYPLHFIDFETCTPAIPFKKGFAPYSEIAFQFSHHVMHKDGRVEHAGEFIDLKAGSYPTFHFMRELKRQLEKDEGTIFRYSNHENSVINRALFLLERSDEADKKDLISFFKKITVKKDPNDKKVNLWKGHRVMVDLLELVKSCYLSPLMGSSNSLKYVLPAILNESGWLQQRYSKPMYGTADFPSLNFKNHAWIKNEGGVFSADPYQQLAPLFSAEDLVNIDKFISDEDEAIKNGGAAMMAYCKSQFTQMSDEERGLLSKALLKYCELDTLAMVMLVEYWRDVCQVRKAA